MARFTRDQRAVIQSLREYGSLPASTKMVSAKTIRSLSRRGVINLRRVPGHDNLRWVLEPFHETED